MMNRARASPSSADDLVERREPVVGLVGVDVGQLVLELVEIHGGQLGVSRRVVSMIEGSSISG